MKIGGIVALALVLSACGSKGGSGRAAAPTRDERCLNVPASIAKMISRKLKDGGTLTSAQAVKSFDYESPTYFVSAKLPSGDVGTWAVGKLGGAGPVYAVDDVAKAASTWPAGDTSSTYVSMIYDGAEPSRDCVAAS